MDLIFKLLTKPLTWGVIIIVVLATALGIYVKKSKSLQEDNLKLLNNLEVAVNDVKYYKTKDSATVAEAQIRIAEMQDILEANDNKLAEELKELDIKKSEVRQIVYQTLKVDTIVYRPFNPRDTIIDFSDMPDLYAKVFLAKDTASLDLKLKPEIKTIFTAEKVPVGKRKKTIVGKTLQNWFGKKRIIAKAYSKSYNKYVEFEDFESVIIDPK